MINHQQIDLLTEEVEVVSILFISEKSNFDSTMLI